MHTSVSDPAILVVFELVAKFTDTAGDDIGTSCDVGCGWGFIPLFKKSVKSVDVSDTAATPATRYFAHLLCLVFLLFSDAVVIATVFIC